MKFKQEPLDVPYSKGFCFFVQPSECQKLWEARRNYFTSSFSRDYLELVWNRLRETSATKLSLFHDWPLPPRFYRFVSQRNYVKSRMKTRRNTFESNWIRTIPRLASQTFPFIQLLNRASSTPFQGVPTGTRLVLLTSFSFTVCQPLSFFNFIVSLLSSHPRKLESSE